MPLCVGRLFCDSRCQRVPSNKGNGKNEDSEASDKKILISKSSECGTTRKTGRTWSLYAKCTTTRGQKERTNLPNMIRLWGLRFLPSTLILYLDTLARLSPDNEKTGARMEGFR